jgi:hypothetical protein
MVSSEYSADLNYKMTIVYMREDMNKTYFSEMWGDSISGLFKYFEETQHMYFYVGRIDIVTRSI